MTVLRAIGPPHPIHYHLRMHRLQNVFPQHPFDPQQRLIAILATITTIQRILFVYRQSKNQEVNR